MKRTIFVVEDDPNIRLGLEEVLKSEGFQVTSCGKGDEAIPALRNVTPDLMILDVMLPGMSGFDICKTIRKSNTSLPILMLTAKGQEMDKVVGLELGADDYVTKPFGLRELMARVHALLRRSGTKSEPTSEQMVTFSIGENQINPRTFELCRDSTRETLTAKELKLLQLFHAHPGEVLSRDRLLNEVWGYNYYGTTRTLDQVIVQLRKKLGDTGSEPRHLATVHGVGYKLIFSS